MNKLGLVFILIFHSWIALSQTGELLYLPFDGSVENQSNYSMVSKEHGVIIYTADRYGTPCKAAYFDGSSYVEIMNNAVLNKINTSFSVTVWFKFEETLNPDTWLTVVCKGDNIQETPNNPHFRAQIFQNPKQSTVSINTEFTEHDRGFQNHFFPSKKWAFYSLVYDGNTVTTYMNGVKIWSKAYYGSLNANTSSLFIAKDIPGAIEFYKGSFDELKLFDYALTEDAVKRMYHDGSSYNLTDYKIHCPEPVVVTNTIGRCGATIDYFSPMSFSCTHDSIHQLKGPPTGSFFDVGKTSVVFEVKRGGKKSICKNTVEVLDQENPIIVCPNDTTIYITTPNWEYVEQRPIYSDNCMIDTVFRVDRYKSVSRFAPGSYRLQYRAIDMSANKSSCVYSINIYTTYKDTVTFVASASAPIVNVDTLVSDSIIDDPVQPIDSLEMEIEDAIHIKGIYDFTDEYVTMVIYDHDIQDDDSISVYFNNKRIVNAEPVLLMKNGPIVKTLRLNKEIENKVVIQALNMGTTGKNTVKIDFYEGKDVDYWLLPAKFSKVYNSEPGRATAIKLNYKE